MTGKKICVICGVEFEPNSPSQRICGSESCLKERRREYTRKHAEMYRELNKEYRKKKKVKKQMAAYDKKYQQEHKQQIKEYKKMWYQKQRFLNSLEKGEILKNIYWYSLSANEKQEVLDKIR